jgi:serine/threonine protein kinase
MLKTVNNFYFVYEYCNGGTLEKLLKERGALP